MSFRLKTTGFVRKSTALEETLFHNANGYIGIRSNFEEAAPDDYSGVRGAYINAFYDLHSINHPEKLYGFPETGEKILNVTDVQTIRTRVDGDELNLSSGTTSEYRRTLDMEKGWTVREFLWKSPSGKQVEICSRRLASFKRPEIFAIEYTLKALDPVSVDVESVVCGNVTNHFDPNDPRVSGEAFCALKPVETSISGNTINIISTTKTAGFRLWVKVIHGISVKTGKFYEPVENCGNGEASLVWTIKLEEGESLTLDKTALFSDSRHHSDGLEHIETVSKQFKGMSFSDLAAEQERYLADFWSKSGIEIDGDDHTLKGLRYNLFNLLQSAPGDPVAGIPAKGLSGEGYEGHYFWDTEIYMFPFFLYTRPSLARNLLMFRYTTLAEARKHARILGHKRGAAFPWRTIAGRECSAYYPSGSAQYHINADIAYAIWQYWEATDDLAFILNFGAEILIETARIWMEIGNFYEDGFHINTVTGPDEYTCLVNNNYYTNNMAARNLKVAADIVEFMSQSHPAEFSRLAGLLDLKEAEPQSWKKAAAAMVVPYDRERDMNPQDDSFFQKPLWDFEGTPADNYPLLLHYHHMTLSRYQVCKQADTVLAYILLGGDGSESTIRNSFRYYESITTHDSSLSYAAFAIMAARLGDAEKAYEYFTETAALDLDDSHGNTKDGIHAANMGGTWMATVWGFGGFRPHGKVAGFSPILPRKWRSLRFRIHYRAAVIEVWATHDSVRLALCSGAPCYVDVYGIRYNLESELIVTQGIPG